MVDRKSLLFNSFMNTLRGGALDAQMAFLSGSKPFLQARSKGVCHPLHAVVSNVPLLNPMGVSPWDVARWHSPDNVNPYDIFTLGDILSMMKFHNSVVKPLAPRSADRALQNPALLPGAHAFSAPLTETEETQIYRALYRYQACANFLALGGE